MPEKPDIHIKRIYESPEADDGYRILIDRLWPRGIKKQDARLDEWNKALAPSPALRKWFDHKKERFAEFSRRYQKELVAQKEHLTRINEISKTKRVTVLYAVKDPGVSHAPVLYKTLKSLKQKA